MQVDDAEDRVVVAGLGRAGGRLGVDPPPDGAQVVAEMHLTSRFDPGKDPRHGRPRYRPSVAAPGTFSLVAAPYHKIVIRRG